MAKFTIYKINNDLVYELTPEGEKLREDLRYNEDKNTIERADRYNKFYIDRNGFKHIKKYENDWQELECKWNDELIFDKKLNKWRVKTEEDKKKELIEKNIRKLEEITDKYILNLFKKYNEDFNDIVTEIQYLEGRILYLAALYNINITIDEIKQKIALFITNKYTKDDAIKELRERGLNEEQINEFMKVLTRAAEIAKLINLKEIIWQKEEEIEKEIRKGKTFLEEEIVRIYDKITSEEEGK